MVDQNLQEACRVCNMTLLSIHNSEEQRFVHETLTHKSKSNLVHWNPIGPRKTLRYTTPPSSKFSNPSTQSSLQILKKKVHKFEVNTSSALRLNTSIDLEKVGDVGARIFGILR